MNSKSQYKTKHSRELEEYLQSIPGVHFTVADICDHFTKTGQAIGTTTVYRQLERMVDEGIVNKYIIDANSPACFEFVGKDEHCGDEVCFHCKCEVCGKLIHLHCDELVGIGQHLLSEHHFLLKSTRTVFYGVCEDCQNLVSSAS